MAALFLQTRGLSIKPPSSSKSPAEVAALYEEAGKISFIGFIVIAASILSGNPIIGFLGFLAGSVLYATAYQYAKAATSEDMAFYGGTVYASLNPRLQTWFDFMFLPHP
jgi:hypothetical protein